MSIIKKYSTTITKTNAFIINYCPYLIYILLISRDGNFVRNLLPLAFFYAFRRTALFIFIDLRSHYSILGWIGIVSAALGYFLGLFGQLNGVFWDLYGIFAGIGAAIFPAASNQMERIKKYKNLTEQKSQLGILLGIFIVTLSLIALTIKRWPVISFALLLFYSVVGIINYSMIARPQVLRKPIKLHFTNLVIVLMLWVAMFLMEYGRNTGVVNIVQWSVVLLALFIIALLILLFVNRQRQTTASYNTYLQIILYGICAQFWITYSAVFITIVHGVTAFYWVFASYIAGIILGKPVVKLFLRIFKMREVTISISGIILGILLTFWFPGYFIGIFLIRAFASYQKSNALDVYEVESNNYQSSYIVSYYLTSASAMITLLLMWGSLLLLNRLSGFNAILNDMLYHKLATQYLWSIDMTHIVMAAFMILMALYTLHISREE